MHITERRLIKAVKTWHGPQRYATDSQVSSSNESSSGSAWRWNAAPSVFEDHQRCSDLLHHTGESDDEEDEQVVQSRRLTRRCVSPPRMFFVSPSLSPHVSAKPIWPNVWCFPGRERLNDGARAGKHISATLRAALIARRRPRGVNHRQLVCVQSNRAFPFLFSEKSASSPCFWEISKQQLDPLRFWQRAYQTELQVCFCSMLQLSQIINLKREVWHQKH